MYLEDHCFKTVVAKKVTATSHKIRKNISKIKMFNKLPSHNFFKDLLNIINV